jgi:hypothetical protein
MGRGQLALAAIVTALAAAPALACGFPGQPAIGAEQGYDVYPGLLVMEGEITGERLQAYQGIDTATIGACLSACRSEAHCAAITFRPGPRTCLKFGTINFVTEEPMRPILYPEVRMHRSIVVRSNGTFCGPG